MKPIHFIPVIGIIIFLFDSDADVAWMPAYSILCLGLFQGASMIGLIKLLELFT